MIKVIIASMLFSISVWAAPTTPALQYVGSISIQPSQDSKILADWYQKFGIELHSYGGGGYFGYFETAGGPFYFGIHPKQKDAAEKSSRSVSVVFRVNDYDGYVSKLKTNGLNPESVEADETGHFAHYRDPDGNEMTIWGD